MLWVKQFSRFIHKLYIEMESINHSIFLYGNLLLINQITVTYATYEGPVMFIVTFYFMFPASLKYILN